MLLFAEPMADSPWLQSYSGVRARLGLGPGITTEADAFAFRDGYCYALSRLQARPQADARFLLARDPRPTGVAVAAAQADGLATACRDLGVRLELVDLGIVTTPVWQHAVRWMDAHGGVMVTASHNPIEDNGWKYATGVAASGIDPAPPGALLSAPEMANLIRAAGAFRPVSPRVGAPDVTDAREAAIGAYVEFVGAPYRASIPGARIVVDLNGGAACGIADRAFRAIGVEPIVVNADVGLPAHEIDVEHVRSDGTHVLDTLAARVQSEGALFGLAFDFDADRGNLTYVDAGRARVPTPQSAAAINAAVALALHRRAGESRPAVVVVSDATSCRVTRIARAFGAEVIEVETGEINVVTAMQRAERRGQRAVVGVEGPSGGTIFAGTTCRDGTLVGAGALLASADRELRAIIAGALAPGRAAALDAGLAGLVHLLPAQRSFTATERTAGDWHGTVSAIEQRWKAAFEAELAPVWRRFEIQYSHTSYVGPDRLAASGYGWKARLFTDAAEGFLWIRPSKTEAGIVRLVGDGPDEPSARTLLALGRRLLAAVPA